MAGIGINNGVVNYGGSPSLGANTAANRPAAGVRGRLFVDTTNNLLQYDTGLAWATIGGAGISGSGAAGQATFWTGTSAISGDNAFFWDNTNKRLGLGTTTPGVRADFHGTNVIQQLNGTTTNSAFLDFQNAGTTRIRIGNDYNGGSQIFSVLNSGSNYFIAGIQSNGRILFNTPNYTSIGAQFEFYNFTTLTAMAIYQYGNNNVAAFYNTYKTRGTTKGTFSATLDTDVLGSYGVAGSTNADFVSGAYFAFIQNGNVGTQCPTDIAFSQYNTTSVTQRLRLYNTGYSQFIDRVSINNASDNANFELNNNGNFYTNGFSPAFITLSSNTTLTRTMCGIVVSATCTLTLPTASGLNNIYYIFALSGVTVTINRSGSDTITNKTGTTGLTTLTLTGGGATMLYIKGGDNITYQIF